MNVNVPLCLLDVSQHYKVMMCHLLFVLLPQCGQNSHWSQVSKLCSWSRSDCFVPAVYNWGFCDRGVRFITPHIYLTVESASSKYNLFCHTVVIHAWEYTIWEQFEPESPDVLDNTTETTRDTDQTRRASPWTVSLQQMAVRRTAQQKN